MREHLSLPLIAIAFLTLAGIVSPLAAHGQPASVQATQNLSLDPWGRVVDMSFDQDLSLTAPWDRFRFDMDSVQPLAWGGGAFLGELTGDAAPDLVVADLSGRRIFFPGLTGSPTKFGAGTYLKHTTTQPADDPFYDAAQAGLWVTGDAGDLDQDSKNELVIGLALYRNVGSALEPKLDLAYTFASPSGNPDAAASIGDLDLDGKADVVITYSGETWVFWNHSVTGKFDFTAELLKIWPHTSALTYHLGLGDLNGDKLVDLAGPAGIYYNIGTVSDPVFEFDAPADWHKSGGPDWTPSTDRPAHIYLHDADGDGLVDAYVSNLSTTAWPILYYRNTGSSGAHDLQYIGPILAAGAPIDIAARGKPAPDKNPNSALVAAADIDGNGLEDILLSTKGPLDSEAPTLLWNRGQVGQTSTTFSYQDLYTWPPLGKVDYSCGGASDPLCRPPNVFAAWADMAGEPSPDALHAQPSTSLIGAFDMYVQSRTGNMPFALSPDQALLTGTAKQIQGRGVAMLDLDRDGHADLLTGTAAGKLLYYRNTGLPGSFSDSLPLADGSGVTINLNDRTWPAAFDLNGDQYPDVLVMTGDGKIHKFVCSVTTTTPCTDGGLLGALEQDPVDFEHSLRREGSIATLDADADGLADLVAADSTGKLWLLKNVGTKSYPSFSLRSFNLGRTVAAFLEILGPRQIRLYFALPTVAEQTVISYHDLPTAGELISGQVTISGLPPATRTGTLTRTATPTRTATATSTRTATVTATSTRTPTPKLVTIENEDDRIRYDGWRGVRDSRASGGTYRLSNTTNDDLMCKFIGPSIKWITRKGPEMGKARVTIDGKKFYSIDLYSVMPSWQSQQSYTRLGTGSHTLVITVLGTRNLAATGSFVAVDAFIAGTATIQEKSPLIQFGDWKHSAATGPSGGSYRSNQFVGSSTGFSFTGGAIDWLTAQGPTFGRADVYIDGLKRGPTVDLYSQYSRWKVAVPFSGLGEGVHTIEVRPLGSKRAASRGTKVVLDGFKGRIIPLATSPLLFNDRNARIDWRFPLLAWHDASN